MSAKTSVIFAFNSEFSHSVKFFFKQKYKSFFLSKSLTGITMAVYHSHIFTYIFIFVLLDHEHSQPNMNIIILNFYFLYRYPNYDKHMHWKYLQNNQIYSFFIYLESN